MNIFLNWLRGKVLWHLFSLPATINFAAGVVLVYFIVKKDYNTKEYMNQVFISIKNNLNLFLIYKIIYPIPIWVYITYQIYMSWTITN